MIAEGSDEATRQLLPGRRPLVLIDHEGESVFADDRYQRPSLSRLVQAYRLMLLGRRFDVQATSLTKQGRLAVYPSSIGQEACQIGSALALRNDDWLFPTYRDTMALVARGLDVAEVLTLFRGDWHCGYDPATTRTAPQCTPLATQTTHAAGLAHALRSSGTDNVVLVLIGDGGTSEGDFHEGLNFAAVFNAPVVFLVQNNGYAISVPLEQQSVAPALAYKGIGYGIRSEQVDGNDAAAVLAVLDEAIATARRDGSPFLVEAHTYRIGPHTNADDPSRYRAESEVEHWRRRDPVHRLETYLRRCGALTDEQIDATRNAAEEFAADMRARMKEEPAPDPLAMFDYVYAELTPQLTRQRDLLAAELAAEEA